MNSGPSQQPPPPPPLPGLGPNQYPQEKAPNYGNQIPPGFGQGQGGYLALVDEDTGEEVGVVEQVHVSGAIKPGSNEPVQVELPPVGSDGVVTIRPSDEEYLKDSRHPAFANSSLVTTAAMASRFIVTAATYAAKAMESGAQTFTQKTKPVAQPITFTPATHDRVRQVHNFTSGAAKVSASTLGKVQHHAQNIGAKISGKDKPRDKPSNPGLLSKGMIAVSTIADGIDHASKVLLQSGSNAATTVVGHRYGEEAREVARGLTGSAKNVGLVYVDAAGVSRRAIVKSVAKGMVVGKVKGGGEVIVQGENGSQIDLVGPGGSTGAQFHPPPLQRAKTWSPEKDPALFSPQPQYGPNLGPQGYNQSGYASGRSSPMPTYGTPPPPGHMYPPPPGTPQPQSYPPPPTQYRY